MNTQILLLLTRLCYQIDREHQQDSLDQSFHYPDLLTLPQ